MSSVSVTVRHRCACASHDTLHELAYYKHALSLPLAHIHTLTHLRICGPSAHFLDGVVWAHSRFVQSVTATCVTKLHANIREEADAYTTVAAHRKQVSVQCVGRRQFSNHFCVRYKQQNREDTTVKIFSQLSFL